MEIGKILTLGLITLVVSLSTEADIYRWVDKEGKVHFTDKKPAPDAQNITAKVKPSNIDTSSTELQKAVAKREQEDLRQREKNQLEQQRRKPEIDQQRQIYCAKKKERLRKISGRIVFIDEQGRAVTVTEKERQEMVTTLKQHIQTTCD